MDLLPPETLTDILVKVPKVGQYIIIRVSKWWRDVLYAHVIKDKTTVHFVGSYVNGYLVRNPYRRLNTGIKIGDVVEYIFSNPGNIELYKMMAREMPELTIDFCKGHALNAHKPNVLVALNKMFEVQLSWHDILKLGTYNDGNIYTRTEHTPVKFRTFISHSGLKMDWWAVLRQISYTQWRWVGERVYALDVVGTEHVKLIFTRIIIDNKYSSDAMFLELARNNVPAPAMKYLRDVYMGDLKLSYSAMNDLMAYHHHFAMARELDILPTDNLEYIIENSNDYKEIENAVELISNYNTNANNYTPYRTNPDFMAAIGYPREYKLWIGMCAIMNRADKMTLRYFNSHRSAVTTCFTQALNYARKNKLDYILKSLNGFKSSKFSHVYDFIQMKVTDKRKSFAQRK